jgi:hypothetical protein
VPDQWTSTLVRRDALRIRNQIRLEDRNLPVATLRPVYPIEAGLGIYPELAGGLFVYRVADWLTPEQREHYHTTSPHVVERLLNERPPGAILVGFYPDYPGLPETPLIEYAESHEYRKVRIDNLDLYLRH